LPLSLLNLPLRALIAAALQASQCVGSESLPPEASTFKRLFWATR
jgi:hypothetical protein